MQNKHLAFLTIGTAALVVFGAGCGYGSTLKKTNVTSNTSTTQTFSNPIRISGMAFSPTTLTVAKGTTVTWANDDTVGHTVTGDNGGPKSGTINNHETYSYTFNAAGTFKYHCSIHPSMTGTVIVQ